MIGSGFLLGISVQVFILTGLGECKFRCGRIYEPLPLRIGVPESKSCQLVDYSNTLNLLYYSE